MKYTVYKITNLVNGKVYIGVHKTENLNDKYYKGEYYRRKNKWRVGRAAYRTSFENWRSFGIRGFKSYTLLKMEVPNGQRLGVLKTLKCRKACKGWTPLTSTNKESNLSWWITVFAKHSAR